MEEVGINAYYEPDHFKQLCEDDYNVSRTGEYEKNSMHHIHNSCEILFIEEGICDYFVLDKCYHIEPGDILVISALKHHTRVINTLPYIRYGLTVLPQYYKTFIFEPNLLKVFETPTPEDFEKYYKNIDKNTFKKLTELLADLYYEQCSQDSDNPMKKQMEKTIIQEIAIILYRAFNMKSREIIIDPYQNERVERMKDYIDKNYRENITLEDLSKTFYMHPSNISKYFHKYSGFTINQYLNTVRVSEAQKLLENTSLNISVIAELSGFGSVNNFIRQFKSIMTRSPLQYRKEYRSYISDHHHINFSI